MTEVIIAAYARTPIGEFLGSFSNMSAADLGVIAAKSVVEKAQINPETIEEVVCGTVHQEGQKGNPARQIQLGAGLPYTGWAATINQQCSSGVRATEMIAQNILLGKIEVGIAAGAECMSSVPYLLLNARKGYRMGDAKAEDALFYDGFICAMNGYHMGITAEDLAIKYNISRQEQDEWALRSHTCALAAWKAHKFDDAVVPVEIAGRKGEVTTVKVDEHPRATTLEALAKLKPAFKKDGTVTAGNASGINDAGAAMLLMSKNAAEKSGVKPLAKVLATASAGCDPKYMGIGPAYAIPKVLRSVGLTLEDIGCFEINEAFAAQLLACNRELKIPVNKLNVNGSGIGLGHPVGATGIRIIGDMIYELKRRGEKYGVASLCAGGGVGIAAVIEVL